MFKYEACVHLHRTIQAIHAAGMKAGVTLNPSTPVNVLEDIIGDVDIVQLMSVTSLVAEIHREQYQEVQRLRQLIDREGSKALIEVDGRCTG